MKTKDFPTVIRAGEAIAHALRDYAAKMGKVPNATLEGMPKHLEKMRDEAELNRLKKMRDEVGKQLMDAGRTEGQLSRKLDILGDEVTLATTKYNATYEEHTIASNITQTLSDRLDIIYNDIEDLEMSLEDSGEQ